MPDTPIPWVGRAALVAIFLLPFVSGHMKLPVGGQLSLDPPFRFWGWAAERLMVSAERCECVTWW
jgi:hypothetical protein